MGNEILYIAISFTLAVGVMGINTCLLHNEIDTCTYTVTCSEYSGSAPNPTCTSSPYVTFVMKKSFVNYLTAGFFGATNFDSRVREFIAIDNTWITIESMAFKYYFKVIRMDLSSNNIKVIQNYAFKNLAYLHTLNLSRNAIETLQEDSFTFADNKHTILSILDLSYNNIKELSNDFSQLPVLKQLCLQGNNLANINNNCFLYNKQLTGLYLQNNKLTTINAIAPLKNLTDLDISYNNINNLTSDIFTQLTSLIYLNASHNNIEILEDCFNELDELESVDLSYNRISSKIDNVMFSNCVGLVYLNLFYNNITVLEKDAFKYNAFSYFNIGNNNLTGNLTYGRLSLKNIEKIDLSRQQITGILNMTFAEAPKLNNLNLSRNIIKYIDDDAFHNSSIVDLDLSYNYVNNLRFLKNTLLDLKYLYMNHNNISTVMKDAFIEQALLEILDLSMNKIVNIEPLALPLRRLQYLNIMGNSINGNLAANVVSPAKYLRFLDLSHFKIDVIQEVALKDMQLLARLNISNNDITSIEAKNFIGMDNMYSLDLSYNKLSNIDFNITNLKNLRSFYLNNNKIVNIGSLLKNSSILYLDVSHNQISDIKGLGPKYFPNLNVLYMNNNEMLNFNNPQTNSLVNLVDLDVSSNHLTEINLSYFKNLMRANLSNNSLIAINSTMFDHLDKILSLDISSNKILELIPGTFQSTPELKLLNLSSNSLSKLRYGSLRGLNKTRKLDLSRNLITDLDVDVFHVCTDLEALIIDNNRIKTLDVEGLVLASATNLKSLSLGGNPMLCKEIVHHVNNNKTNSKQLVVTSLEKIYHEDNVHGIRCGDIVYTTTVLPVTTDKSIWTSTAIWTILGLVLLVTVVVVIYFNFNRFKHTLLFTRNLRAPLSSSVELEGSECENDLLS